jgi:hypothetical protein
MILSYTSTPQTVGVNENLEFDIDRIKTGCTVTHAAGTPTFTLNKPGFYYIAFTGTASATAAATDPITVQFYDGINAIGGATASALSAAADTPVNISITTIIQVRPSCPSIDNTVSLTIQNTGIEAIYTDAALAITKLC